MTLKKSLISISAAAVIAASITGCGSSDSAAYFPVGSGSTAQPTSITATDGYVVNYGVTVTYTDSNESNNARLTTSLLTDAITMNTKAAGAAQVKGSSTMNLAAAVASGQLTQAQLDNLVSVNLSRRAQTTDGTTITYASYFDADANGEFNATSGDVLAPAGFTMTAPAGFANITPITTLVQAHINTLTASDTNDTNRSEVAALALSQIAAGLGLSTTDIQNVDPIAAVASNPGYTLINSLLGNATAADLTTLAASLASATAATTPVAALTNIANSGISTATTFASAASQLAADSDMINSVATWNLDEMRENGVLGSFNPVNLTASNADFNVSDINFNATDTSSLLSTGAKVAPADLANLNLVVSSSSDMNVTNKSLTLVMKIGAQEAAVENDANVTSLTISIPLELNNTISATNQIDAAVSGNVIWEGVDLDGNTYSGDFNKSTFNTNASTPVSFAANTGSNAVLTINASNIISAIEGNTSAKLTYADSISDFKVSIVDAAGALQKVNGSNSSYWGNTAIASVLGGINVTGKSLISNATLDSRTGVATAANAAPAFTSAIAADDDMNVLVSTNDNNVSLTSGTALTNTIVVNKGVGTTYLAIPVVSDDEAAEVNSTVMLSGLPSYITAASTTIDAGANDGTADFNLTIEGNASITAESTTVATLKVTDEFGKTDSDNDQNLTFFFNLAPVVGSTTVKDINSTTTASYASIVTLLNGATATSTATCVVDESNATSTAGITCAVTADGNLTIIGGAANDADGKTEVNITVTDAYGLDFNKTGIIVNQIAE